MILEIREHWDELFFKNFSSFKNSLHRFDKSYLEEDPIQLKNELLSPYFVENKITFKAALLKNDHKIVSRIILYLYPPEKFPHLANLLYFGYFDCHETLMTNEIYDFIERICKTEHRTKIRGPMQGHFFFSYRAKLWGDLPFYGEPNTTKHSLYILNKWGFNEYKKWFSSSVNIAKTRNNFSEIRNKTKKKDIRFNKLKIKYLFPWRFNRTIKDIFQLFNNTYAFMSDFNPIDEKTFILLYSRFKLLVNPFFSYTIEYNKNVVGFCINYFDPLPILLEYQNSNSSKKPWSKLILLLKLIFNQKRLLITYVGKSTDSDGNEIKGIQSLVSKHLGFYIFLFRVKEVFVCYTASDSLANKSFNPKNQITIAEYAMFEKNILE